MFERCLYFNVNALARAVNRVWDAAFREYGLSPSHAYLLRLVLSEPGITQKAIAEALALEKSTITRFVDAVEAKGLVSRRRSVDADSRAQCVFPTAKAKRVQAALEMSGDALYQRMGDTLGKKALAELVAQLRLAAEKIE